VTGWAKGVRGRTPRRAAVTSGAVASAAALSAVLGYARGVEGSVTFVRWLEARRGRLGRSIAASPGRWRRRCGGAALSAAGGEIDRMLQRMLRATQLAQVQAQISQERECCRL
jgi:hypothetical protein